MTTPRKIRIKKIADFNAGSSGFAPSYAFVFSDDFKRLDGLPQHRKEAGSISEALQG